METRVGRKIEIKCFTSRWIRNKTKPQPDNALFVEHGVVGKRLRLVPIAVIRAGVGVPHDHLAAVRVHFDDPACANRLFCGIELGSCDKAGTGTRADNERKHTLGFHFRLRCCSADGIE
jgi:hypothetical protein